MMIRFLVAQEYVPEHCGVASKLSWEVGRQIGCNTMLDIARWSDLKEWNKKNQKKMRITDVSAILSPSL